MPWNVILLFTLFHENVHAVWDSESLTKTTKRRILEYHPEISSKLLLQLRIDKMAWLFQVPVPVSIRNWSRPRVHKTDSQAYLNCNILYNKFARGKVEIKNHDKN
jgi:hypothetical protein